MSTTWPYPMWIAHRGAGTLAPENTLAAFRVGAGHGYRAFECDVKLSADGVPFLLHDDTLDRTTSGLGVAGRHSWFELSQLDAGGWHGPAFAGEPIPTLEAIARYVLANGFALNIEIKPTPGEALSTGQVVAREAAQLWAGAGEPATPPLMSSFEVESLQGARDTAEALPRALLVDELWSGWFEAARDLACVAVVANHRLLDADLVTTLHAAGLRALVYTPNEAETVRRLAALGVDGIITDAVDRLSAATLASR